MSLPITLAAAPTPRRSDWAIDLVRPALLARREVVLADLGRRGLGQLAGALQRAGASVRVVTDLAGARREATLSGPTAALVVDATARTRQVLTALEALSRQPAVLVLSTTATSAERIELLRGGADCVLSRTSPEEVVAVLDAVLRRSERGDVMRQPAELHCGDLSVHLRTRTALCGGVYLALTALEFDLLAYFIRHTGQALCRQQLLADVWGHDIGGLDTVTVHVRRLRLKIEADPTRPLLLQTVWGVGYRMVP
ncbi:MAG: response regulator transcription factor, partial [Actinomycetota bacterium]|nr:response regulator transcription factor [Actinomycetota bacterium]